MKTVLFPVVLLVAFAAAARADEKEGLKERAAERAKAMKADVDNFVLHLAYYGPEDKPYYRLTLSVPPPVPKTEKARQDAFYPFVEIDKRQAEKIIDHLADDGFLASAGDIKNKEIGWHEPCYVLIVRGGDMELAQSLGWDAAMLDRLDALRKVLGGEAGKAMDSLIGRLEGHRKEWRKIKTDDEAANRAAALLKAANADWGQPTAILRTGSNWYRVEYERGPQGAERFVLVNPETGNAEFPSPR